MKKLIYTFGVVALFAGLAACSGKKQQEEIKADDAKIAELESSYQQASSFNDSLIMLMGDIYTGLDSINSQEQLLYALKDGWAEALELARENAASGPVQTPSVSAPVNEDASVWMDVREVEPGPGEISLAEAKEIIDGYFATYPGVRRYIDRVIADAREKGYVATLFGRKRMLPDIRSGNAVVRALAERNAVNAPIQGGAADIMKLAMIAVHRELGRRGLKSKIILQVHDELVIDMLRSEEEQVRELVVRCMEDAAELRVRLIAECGVGANWVEAH